MKQSPHSFPVHWRSNRAVATLFFLLLAFAGFLAVSARADDQRWVISGHVPEIVSQLQPVGEIDPSQHLHLAIGLASRDEQGLETFLEQIYTPGSTNFHHYLKPDEFTARFGPTADDYKAAIAFAQANGLNVALQHSNRVVLDVEGAASDVEKALQVKLHLYQHPIEDRTFFAPDTEPSVPAGLPVLHITGLNNYMRPSPKHHRRTDVESNAESNAGTAPGGQLWGNDFRNAYVPGTTLTGAGQSVGLLEFEGYYPSDITAYEDAIGMSSYNRPNLVVVPLQGGATPADGGDNGEECSIDIEMAVAMAPGLANVYVFEDGASGNGNSYFDDILEEMVYYTNVLQFSCSWGGTAEADPTSEVLFKQMAAQGQSFIDASGDQGAFVGPIVFPSDSPSITQVGGTTLTVGSAPSSPWQSEVVWSWDSGATVSAEDAESSSGGISTYYSIPTWQSGISMTANHGSTTMRNTPDVAANADNVYIYSDDGSAAGQWGGTSCAAPLWASLTAMMNEQAVANKVPPVGFLNPTLYALASSAGYTEYFHDITSGNNTWKGSPNKFRAVAGYDLCCGLGSMRGINLINAVVALAGSETNTYGQPSGTLTVTISPAAAVSAGANWQVDGGLLQKSKSTVPLTVGDHTISFKAIKGWVTPADQTVSIADGTESTVSATYTPAGSLKVIFTPAMLTNAGAQWQVDGGTPQNSGATVTDLAAGVHVVSFIAINGWNTPSNVTVTIRASTLTTVTKAYTLEDLGTYNGLFMTPQTNAATEGMLKNLVVSKSGTYSGRLLLAGGNYSVAGAFNGDGLATNSIGRPAGQGGPLSLALALKWGNSPPTITGSVTGGNGAWVASLTNEIAAGRTASAEYTALLSPGTPPGNGYILITNHAGAFTLSGALADGTAFTQETPVCGLSDVPVYASLRGGSELLIGWMSLASNAPTGNLTWIKQPSASGLYSQGFTNDVSIAGSLWTAPAPHTAPINLPAGLLNFSGGGLTTNVVFNVAVVNDSIVNAGTPANALTGSINPKTGLVKLTFANGSGGKTAATGAALQSTTNAGGFFLGKTSAGSFILQP